MRTVAQVLLGAGALVILAAVVLPWYRFTAEISGDSAIQIATSAQTETLAQASLAKALMAVLGAGLAVGSLFFLPSSQRVTLALAGVGTLVAVAGVVWAVAAKPDGFDEARGFDRSFRTLDVQTDTALRAGAYIGVAGALLLVAGTAALGGAGPPRRGRD